MSPMQPERPPLPAAPAGGSHAVEAVKTPLASGLTATEAAERERRFGRNAIDSRPVAWWTSIGRRFWGPVPWMLEAVIALELMLSHRIEAAVIGALLAFNAVVSERQERRASEALAALRRQLPVTAKVIRDGRWQPLAAERLVPGDVVHVRAGDFVPADVHLADGHIAIDQSSLTGEALPVEAGPGEQAPAGALVRRGEATAWVTATGRRTLFGRTAELVQTAAPPSHMQRAILSIVRRLVVVDIVVAALAGAYALWHGQALAETTVFVLMLLVASVPVALPATYTLATALAGQSLSRRGVLLTRLPAIEDAAAMEVLVTDKTGTLTENRLAVGEVVALAPGASAVDVLRQAAIASAATTQDPLDLALLERAAAEGPASVDARPLDFRPFDPLTRRSEGLFEIAGRQWLALKGATQTVAERCELDEEARHRLAATETALERSGARVLAVAAGPPGDVRLYGLVSFVDPVRRDAPALVTRLRGLGISMRMATGDAAATAQAVATQVGLGTRTVEGAAGVTAAAASADVFARVLPEDKHALVAALQRAGHVVGMTGDGVNDAPALRQAELGIAVASATDVAKAAAGVVLVEPGLAGVLDVVGTGREVHRRLLTYTLNKVLKTVVIVSALTLGLLATGRFVMSSVLVVLLLFANDFVTMALALDRAPAGTTAQGWQVGTLVRTATMLALPVLVAGAAFYAWAQAAWPLTPEAMQTVAFLVLVFFGQASVYALRTDGRLWSHRPALLLVAASLADLFVVSVMAWQGWIMAAVPAPLLAALLPASVALALLLDQLKRPAFRRLGLL